MIDPELEERQACWAHFRNANLETLNARLPYRIVCAPVEVIEAHRQQFLTLAGRRQFERSVATLVYGTCAVCQGDVFWGAQVMPREPMKICIPCAKANLGVGDVLFLHGDQVQKPARKRRQSVSHGR